MSEGFNAAQAAADASIPDWPLAREREARRVVCWRYWQARLLGLEPLAARLVAASDADLAELRTLVNDRGCPPALAALIVL